MAITNRFKHLRGIEAGINKNLFLICSGVTIITMLMVVIEFVTRGAFPPTRMTLFYAGVLIIYSFHKELIRWLGKGKAERQGEYFVYSWIGLTTILHIINFLSRDYFSYSPQGEPLEALQEASFLTLEVLAIFILTRGLKVLRVFLKKPASSS